MAAGVRYLGDTVEVSARGSGAVHIAKGPATKVVLNGKPLNVKAESGQFRLEVGRPGKIELTAPQFATDAGARCQGIGVPQGYGGVYKGPPQSALVRFKTSMASDMTIEWRGKNETVWKRVVNPEPLSDHYYLLTDLEHGKTYQVRLTCRGPEEHAGMLQKEFTYSDPEKAGPKP